MGTNYYAHIDTCDKCNHPAKVLHIGKSSCGWSFTFRGYASAGSVEEYGCEIKSYGDWLKFLVEPNVHIVNEYGETVSLDEFVEMVGNKKDSTLRHYDYVTNPQESKWYKPDKEYLKNNWLDANGNSFTDWDFC